MRKIKFRALYRGNWVYFDLNRGFTDEGYEIYKELVEAKAEFSQSTDLLDKNGKEIYGGDIIAWFHGKKSKNQPPDITGQVFWSEFQLHWALDGKYRHPHPIKDIVSDDTGLYKFRSNGRIEIIGNMSENPNLLTKGE